MVRSSQTRFLATIIIWVSAIIAGCGGGSGSAGGPGGGSWTSQYSGSRDPAIVDKGSAVNLASLAMTALYLPKSYEGVWLPNPLGNGTGDVSESIPGPSGGLAIVTGRIEPNREGFIEVQFRSFGFDGATINGQYRQTYGPGDAGRMEFIDLSVNVGIGQLVYSGSTDIAEGRQQIMTNLIVSSLPDRQQLYLDNVAMTFSGTDIGGDEIGQISISGSVFDTQAGRITIESNGPIVAPDFNDGAGSIIATKGGGFFIRGNGPLLQFRALSRQFAALALDVDNDGSVDESFRLTWRELFELDDSPLVASEGPVANAGGVQYGTTGNEVNLHGFFSHDVDGDWLGFDWWVVAKPPASNLQLGESSRPELTFVPDAPGDYVLGLEVTDGVYSSKSSVNVLVDAHEFRVGPTDPPTGNIEIGSPVAVGVPITVDARSAANIPYLGAAPAWSVFGPGFASVDPTTDPYVAEMLVDQPGKFLVGMGENGESRGVVEAGRFVTVAVGSQDFEVETWMELAEKGIARGILPYDFNLDDRPDVAITIFQDGEYRFHWLLSNENEGYDVGPLLAIGAGGMDIGDLNGDQLPDVAVGDSDGVYVGYQQSPGVMLEFVLLPLPETTCDSSTSVSVAKVGDIDGDTLNDLVALRGCDHTIQYWLGMPDGTMSGPTPLPTTMSAFEMQAADFDNDQRMDLLLGLANNPGGARLDEIVVAFGQADGSFQVGTPLPVFPEPRTRPIVGDLDSNGRPDILVFEQNGYRVFEGLDSRSLVETKSSTQVLTYYYLNHAGGHGTVVDVDKDGNADIVACSGIGVLNISYLQADGSYLQVPNGNCRWNDVHESLAIMDFNGDRTDDLLIGDEGFFPANRPPWTFMKVRYGGISSYSRPTM